MAMLHRHKVQDLTVVKPTVLQTLTVCAPGANGDDQVQVMTHYKQAHEKKETVLCGAICFCPRAHVLCTAFISLGRDTGGGKINMMLYLGSKDTSRPYEVELRLCYYDGKTKGVERLTAKQLRIGLTKQDRSKPGVQIFSIFGYKNPAKFPRLLLNEENNHSLGVPFRVDSTSTTHGPEGLYFTIEALFHELDRRKKRAAEAGMALSSPFVPVQIPQSPSASSE